MRNCQSDENVRASAWKSCARGSSIRPSCARANKGSSIRRNSSKLRPAALVPHRSYTISPPCGCCTGLASIARVCRATLRTDSGYRRPILKLLSRENLHLLKRDGSRVYFLAAFLTCFWLAAHLIRPHGVNQKASPRGDARSQWIRRLHPEGYRAIYDSVEIDQTSRANDEDAHLSLYLGKRLPPIEYGQILRLTIGPADGHILCAAPDCLFRRRQAVYGLV